MDNTSLRRKRQIAFIESNKNIEFGSLHWVPLSLDELKNIDEYSNCVFQTISSGLTSLNYNLLLDNKKYNLKIKRDKILVDNEDGLTSFLNEVQRRQELEVLRVTNPTIDKGIVKTIYANFREGIILSEYIDGSHDFANNVENLKTFFDLLFELDVNGFFEWDLCPGNILFTRKNTFKLFDFGYMYKFDPLNEFNNNGLDSPGFNPIERFETRSYMHKLIRLPQHLRIDKYRELIELKYRYIERKLEFLKEKDINRTLENFYNSEIERYIMVLSSPSNIEKEWIRHYFTTLKLEVEDDISGKSCSKHTIKKLEGLYELLENNFSVLLELKVFKDNPNPRKHKLLKELKKLEKLVYKFQL